VPSRPKIFHITPVANLASIARDGLRSDTCMTARGGPTTSIGMSKLKQRRFTLDVGCHPGTSVADFVPFYFCPRSVMLYMIFKGNDPDLGYRGGQEPIVHLEVDMHDVIEWANGHGAAWAFSSSNASSRYAEFFDDIGDLHRIDWSAVAATSWATVKEAKQAELLVRDHVPWALVTAIGVYSSAVLDQVADALANVPHKPEVSVRRNWYYP
jgi:hypothetical protein